MGKGNVLFLFGTKLPPKLLCSRSERAGQGVNNYLFPGKVVNSLFGTEYWKKQKTLRYIAE